MAKVSAGLEKSPEQKAVAAWIGTLLLAGALALLVWLLLSHLNQIYFDGEGDDYGPVWIWKAFGWLLEHGQSLSILLAPLSFAAPIVVGLFGKVYRTRIPLLLFSLACLCGAALSLAVNIEISGSDAATEALLYNVCNPETRSDCDFPMENDQRFNKMNGLRHAFLMSSFYFFLLVLLTTLGLTPPAKGKLGQGWKMIRSFFA